MHAVAFDTETRGLGWFARETAFLATWADKYGSYWADLSERAQTARFLSALTKADLLVCHNAPFDIHQVRESTGFDVLNLGIPIHDTDLMSRVLHPEGQRKGTRGGHGLKNLAKVYLRADADDAEAHLKELAKSLGHRTLKKPGIYYDLYRAYPEAMIKYALLDAEYTYQLHEIFMRDYEANPDLAKVVDLEHAVMPILIRAEQRGIATDQDKVREFKAHFQREQLDLAEDLALEGVGPECLSGEGSDELLREALQKAGVPLTETTPSGELATNKFALSKFEHDHPVVGQLQEYRKVTRFLNTYIGPAEGVDVLHTSIQQNEAWTGRMSSRRPNMQNWPQRAGKEVRSILVPRPGYKFVVIDYDTIEVRALAWYLGDPAFRQLIADGHDTHAWMASKIYGGELHDWRKDGPKAEGKQSRKTARHTLFAVVYGAGGRKVGEQLGLDPAPYYGPDHPAVVAARERGRNWPQVGWQHDEGRALVNSVRAALPNYYVLTQRIKEKVQAYGHVNTVYGRKSPIPKDKAYVGLSGLCQGSAADIMKLGLVATQHAIDEAKLDAHILLVVHDEVLIEVREEQAEQCLAQATQALESAYPLNPPLKVSGEIVNNYGE